MTSYEESLVRKTRIAKKNIVISCITKSNLANLAK